MLSKSAVCKTRRCNNLFYEDIKKGQYLHESGLKLWFTVVDHKCETTQGQVAFRMHLRHYCILLDSSLYRHEVRCPIQDFTSFLILTPSWLTPLCSRRLPSISPLYFYTPLPFFHYFSPTTQISSLTVHHPITQKSSCHQNLVRCLRNTYTAHESSN